MGFESCHPAVNFLFFAAVLYGSITFDHPVFLAVAYGCAFAYSVQRGKGKAAVFDLMLLPLVWVFALYYAGYHHFGVTVVKQNFIGNNLTVESLVYGLVLGLRGATVCMWLWCLFSVVTSDKVVYLFGKVSPLLSLGLTLLLRLLPRIKREACRMELAQRGIGRGICQGNLWQRLGNGVRIFSMLISWMIQALGLEADSLRSRGSLLRGRTAFSVYRFDNRDRGFVVALCTAMTLTAMGIILGQTKMLYAPRMVWKPLTGMGVATAMGYGILCLLPLGMELWTHYRFSRCRTAKIP